MELQSYTADDVTLTEAIECDPAVMAELGGPIPRERIPEIHKKRLGAIARGAWWFKVVPEPNGPAAGTIGIWECDWGGRTIYEMGWMIRPAFQGRGLATEAGRMILARARTEAKFGTVHAFPGVANAASNSICRKLGFVRLEECTIDYAGRALRCNHWRVDLAQALTSRAD